ncbi:hypothetical protein Bca52824_025076 [Brassica carinata]|uniref:Uncharacterized protein n=1 Tax=Brassica carinata TaxID=52824 RepID=A0A8X7VLP1_BRACI|nr:hypothetical protein Bca52824_025076 [Brassica carinata]
MGDENPRIMHGVIITVYVDRQTTTTVRSFRARRKNEVTSWKRGIGRTKGCDRRANLLAYIRQLRAESLAGESKCDGVDVESENVPDRPNAKKKKRRWIRKMMSKFRLQFLRPFRQKNRRWRYRHFVPDEEGEGEAKSKAYSSDLWGYHAAVYEVEETHEDKSRNRLLSEVSSEEGLLRFFIHNLFIFLP